jgi:hypothetical protein
MVVLVVVEERNILIPVQKGCQSLAKNNEMNHGGMWYGLYLLPVLQLRSTTAATPPLIAIRPRPWWASHRQS